MISIFLCLILTPVLTLASAITEYYRYQSTAEQVQEVMNCAAYSTLTNYDTYLQERFGVFALSQDCNISASYKTNTDRNKGVLGKAVSWKKADNKAKGVWPLSDGDVLRSQLLDFSESTVFTEFLLNDMNIEELLEKLGNLGGLEKLTSATDKIVDVTTNVKDLVEQSNAFIDSVKDIAAKATAVKTAIEEFANTAKTLYETLQSGGYVFDADDSAASLTELLSDYQVEIGALYEKANAVYTAANTFITTVNNADLQGKINGLKETLEKTKTSLQSAKDEVGGISETVDLETEENVETTAEKVSGEALDVFKIISDEMEGALTTAAESLKEETINNFKTMASDLATQLASDFHVDSYATLYLYFATPLSDDAKNNLMNTVISVLQKIDEAGTLDEAGLISLIKEKFLPAGVDFSSIETMVSSVKDTLQNAIDIAAEKFKDAMKESLAGILTTLVQTIKNLFDLDVFYDGDLKAYLDNTVYGALLSGTDTGPYETFLEAMEDMVDAAETFVAGLATFNLVKVLKSVKKLMTSVKKTVKAVKKLAKDVIQKIKELAGYLTGEKGSFYDLLLLSAYMTHNLPSRTNAGAVSITAEGLNAVELEGEALTGFSYSDIPTAQTSGGPSISSGLGGLLSFLSGLSTGGSDKMFQGAELEYVIIGTKSEIANQALTFFDLYILRLLIDLPVVLTNSSVAQMAAAATIASWVVYLIVILGEPLCDAIILANGETSYLVKKGCYLTPNGIPKLIEKLTNIAMANADDELKDAVQNNLKTAVEGKMDTTGYGSFDSGGLFDMDYKVHMLLILMVSTTEEGMLQRLADLMQLERNAYNEANGKAANFKIKKAYTAMEAESTFTLKPFYHVYSFDDASILKKTCKMTRSY